MPDERSAHKAAAYPADDGTGKECGDELEEAIHPLSLARAPTGRKSQRMKKPRPQDLLGKAGGAGFGWIADYGSAGDEHFGMRERFEQIGSPLPS